VRFDVARFDACAEAARLVVRTDDLREEGHRLLMTSLARSGQVDEALRHYENLEVFLRQELGSEPEPETRRLAEQLRSDVSSAG
jgi:DNA-binding SARP family transcriptional activator